MFLQSQTPRYRSWSARKSTLGQFLYRLENDVVVTPAGWKDAYRRFIDAGWGGLLLDKTTSTHRSFL